MKTIVTGCLLVLATPLAALADLAGPAEVSCSHGRCGDIMDVRNYSLLDYRRMFMSGRTPTPAELQGQWRGVNKGIVRLFGFRQFIKEIQPSGCTLVGDNIQVHQVSDQLLRCCGWQPKFDARTGMLERNGRYLVKRPTFRGPFGHGVVFSYREGGNPRGDLSRLIVDQVVMIDHHHLLGRASVRLGLVKVPVAYFVLERI